MELFALYGPSGTGKSTNALALAHKHHIQAIIDDGLLIYQGRKVAGTSAKYEKTTVQAVKRAIFFYPEHATEVIDALKDFSIDRLLLLGTSQKMVRKIQEALQLPEIDHFIHISDIRSSSQIKAALFDRETQGRHVIPIPRVQVEQDFLTRLISRVEKIFSPKKEEIGETTIVHPQFQTGKIHVSETVMKKIIQHSCHHISCIKEYRKVRVDLTRNPIIDLDLRIELNLGQNLKEIAHTIQQTIYNAFVEHLNLEIDQITVTISQVNIQPSQKEIAIPSL